MWTLVPVVENLISLVSKMGLLIFNYISRRPTDFVPCLISIVVNSIVRVDGTLNRKVSCSEDKHNFEGS